MTRKFFVVLSVFILLPPLLSVMFVSAEVKVSKTAEHDFQWRIMKFRSLSSGVHNVNTGLNYMTIQEAINANETLDGHTILVDAGTYHEHLVMNKSIRLVGESAETTIIDGGGVGNVTKITADNVNITGFTIKNSGKWPNSGITLNKVKNCNVSGNGITANNGYGVWLCSSSNNNITRNSIAINWDGVWLYSSSNNNNVIGNNITNNNDGVWLYSSSNNNITGNSITNNEYGVRLVYYSSNNSITGNNVTANNRDGVWLYSSSNNTIHGNNITANNGCGVWLHSSSNNNNVIGNNITNNEYGILLDSFSNSNSMTGNSITANNRYGVWLYSSSNNNITGNSVINNGAGIILYYSSNNSIRGNNVKNSYGNGISLSLESSNNSVIGNNITANNGAGIKLYSSSNNRVFHNNFVENHQHASITDSYGNLWDDGYPSGGNYWSNYTDVDQYSGAYQNETGGDGIWDHPYIIDENNQDNYPIVPEFPSLIFMPLFMIATLAAIAYRRKKTM